MDVKTLILLCMSMCFILVPISAEGPSVITKFGQINGRQQSINVDGSDRNVSLYLGIPYAKPPVKELRFQKPEPISKLDTPYEAKKYGKFCPQASRIVMDGVVVTQSTLVFNGTEYSEDCLFLNIVVPDTPPDKSNGHAVMVWVHGGGYIGGASDENDGSVLAAYGNIIFVTMNYRLGVLGFLSTGDDEAPGNYGLWDQQLAFKWVQENIAAFGGDAQRVTIAGVSAGAMSVIQQGFYPQNRGIFQRVIAQSGTPTLSASGPSRDVLKDAESVGRVMDCNVTESTKELTECLRSKTVDQIYEAVGEGNIEIGSFVPSVDGDFIRTNPNDIPEIVKTRDIPEIEFFRSLDFLSGFTSYEGAVIMSVILMGQQETFMPSKQEMTSFLLPLALQLIGKPTSNKELIQLVAFQYTDWQNSDDPTSYRLQYLQLLGDTLYATPAVELTRIHDNSSSNAKNYLYYLTPKPDNQRWFAPSWIPGATHADDEPFLFPTEDNLPYSDPNQPWNVQLSRKIITYWTNFVKTGNPNLPVQVVPSWIEYTLEDEHYIELEKVMTNASVKQHLYAEETAFWREMFPDLLQAVEKKDGGNQGCVVTNAAERRYVHAPSIVLFVLITVISFVP